MASPVSDKARRNYRRGRWHLLFVVFSTLAGGLLLGASAAGALQLGTIASAALVIWAIAYLVCYHRLYQWRCPQCGQRFFTRPPFLERAFARRCAHCGFRRWGS